MFRCSTAFGDSGERREIDDTHHQETDGDLRHRPKSLNWQLAGATAQTIQACCKLAVPAFSRFWKV